MADLSKDVLKFSKELKRMCRAYPGCEGCPAYSELPCDIRDVTPKLIDAVQKWSDAHPLKTYAQDFREKFPKWGGIPPVCHAILYEGINAPCRCPRGEGVTCEMCWNSPMPEEETS